jgi:hypothetical protein
MGVTINTVVLHPAVRSFIFILIALVLIMGTFVFLSRKYRFAGAFRKAVVLAFFISGLAYAIHADVGWTTWLTRDFQTYGGLGTDEKLLRMEGGLYDFARRARGILPETYQIYSSDVAFQWRMEYFLLPKRYKENSQFIVVIADESSRYDPAKRQFTRDKVKIEDVDMVSNYARNAYILRRRQ